MATMSVTPELVRMKVASWADHRYPAGQRGERAFNSEGTLIRGIAPKWEYRPYDVSPQNHLEALAHIEAATAYFVMSAAEREAAGEQINIPNFSLFTPPAFKTLRDYSLSNLADAGPVFDHLRDLASPQLVRVPAPTAESPILDILTILSFDASDETAALMRGLSSSFLEPVFLSSPSARINRIALEGLFRGGKTDFVLNSWRASRYIEETGVGAINFQLIPLFTGFPRSEGAREVFNAVNPLYSPQALRSRLSGGNLSSWDAIVKELSPAQVTAKCIATCLAMSYAAIGTEFTMSPEELAVITGVSKEEAQQAADLAAADPRSGVMRRQSAKDQPVSYWIEI